MKRVALITGGNRGIGHEVCRQLSQKGYTVLLSARSLDKATKAAKSLGSDIHPLELDVTNEATIERAVKTIQEKWGRLDVLVNNAGIFLEDEGDRETFKSKSSTIIDTFITNTVGPFLLCQKLIPLMKKNNYGRVVNISSGMGQLSEMDGGYPGYRLSKTALNAVTKIFAAETEGTNILVNSVCPGWVKTDMGGEGAERSVEKGAETVVWLATLNDKGPSGGFFRDREPLPW